MLQEQSRPKVFDFSWWIYSDNDEDHEEKLSDAIKDIMADFI